MAEPTHALDGLSLPRRVAIVELLRETLATERELAALYAAFAAGAAAAPLRASLAELAQAKAEHVAALEPLTAGLDAGPEPPSSPPSGDHRVGGDRAVRFSQAFRGERALEVSYRELMALVGRPALYPLLPRLAAEAARHRARLREIYLRYS